MWQGQFDPKVQYLANYDRKKFEGLNLKNVKILWLFL